MFFLFDIEAFQLWTPPTGKFPQAQHPSPRYFPSKALKAVKARRFAALRWRWFDEIGFGRLPSLESNIIASQRYFSWWFHMICISTQVGYVSSLGRVESKDLLMLISFFWEIIHFCVQVFSFGITKLTLFGSLPGRNRRATKNIFPPSSLSSLLDTRWNLNFAVQLRNWIVCPGFCLSWDLFKFIIFIELFGLFPGFCNTLPKCRWLRAEEALGTTVPVFPPTGPLAADVRQGMLGDCYFLAALSAIAEANVFLSTWKSFGFNNNRFNASKWSGFRCTASDFHFQRNNLTCVTFKQDWSTWIDMADRLIGL